MRDSPETVAIVGAGAIGGLVAAELHAAGHRVTLCARHQLDRLVIERDRQPRDFAVSRTGTDREALTMATSPAEVAAHRWIVVTLKTQDTAAAEPWLRSLVGTGTTVVALQNGVEHRERFDALATGTSCLPALTDTAVERTAPGRLRHRAGHEVTVADDPGSDRFAALFTGTALHVRIEHDFTTAAWRKLLSNLAANPLTTLTNRRMEVFGQTQIRTLAADLIREGIAVARTVGAQLEDAETERILTGFDQLPSDGGSSMLYDHLADRPLEIDALTGAVVRVARRSGVATPLNDAILALLIGLDQRERTGR